MTTIDQTLREAMMAHQSGDRSRAWAMYDAVLAAVPHHADALHLKGLLAFEANQLPLAQSLMEAAFAAGMSEPSATNAYGLVLEATGDLAEARLCYHLALRQDPGLLDAAINLSSVLLQLQALPEALTVCRRALRIHPGAGDLWNNLALVFKRANKPERALHAFEQALRYEPGHPQALCNYADLLHEVGQWREALSHYMQTLAFEPQNLRGLMGMGQCLVEQGKLDHALSAFETVLSLQPDHVTAQMGRDWVRDLQKRPQHLAAMAAPVPPAPAESWDIVLFSICPALSMGGGHHPPQIARALTAQGHRVLMGQKFTDLEANEPFFLLNEPFLMQQTPATPYQLALFEQTLTAFSRPDTAPAGSRSGRRALVFTIFSPYLTALIPVARRLGYQIVYWCIDDFEGFGGANFRTSLEQQLMRQCDIVLATARRLETKMRQLGAATCPVIPNGFSRQNFPADPPPLPMPEDLRRGVEKTFIYWGNILVPWFNRDLLDAVSAAHPEWTFNLIGPVWEDPGRLDRPNVHYLGVKPVTALQAYGRHSDIALIPFVNNDLVQAVNPVKAYEYLACGLPILSGPMEELTGVPGIWTADTPQAFETAVAHCSQHPPDPEAVQAFLDRSTWAGRAEALLNVLRSR
jgi:tetratricopeptide (TPR) repeat protein